MSILEITTSVDLSGDLLRNITGITFLNGGTAIIALASSQFDGEQVKAPLDIIGSNQGANIISLNGGSLNLSLWHFTDWQLNDRVILTGGALSDRLAGSAFTDELNGAQGNDALFGRLGDDVIDGGIGADQLSGGGGYDTLYYFNSSAGVMVNLALNTASGGDAEGDTISGFEKVWGSNFDDRIAGNEANNDLFSADGRDIVSGAGGDDFLSGNKGNDILSGDDGDDFLAGGNGRDILVGGLGYDIFNGGDGLDVFVFNSIADSPASGHHDYIGDFWAGQGVKLDSLNLKKIDAIDGGTDDAFTFIGEAAFSKTAGELRYSFTAAFGALLEADTNGDGVADFAVEFAGDPPLSATDFIL